tara:strand:+ start:46 stop:642 length:597 start_codon:yes stop_codon:yes gene_type:complete
MKTYKLSVEEVKENPDNPRIIKDYKFNKLVRSVKDFPKMLELRPIVVDENNIILGGNMRYKAAVQAGLKEVYVIQAKELTEEQKKEFVIKDNSSFGEWDWDILANEWDVQNLKDWGLDIPKWEETDDFDNDLEDTGAYDYPEDTAESSHVKMVQLFLTTETEPNFREWELKLRQKYNTDNLTDTIYQAIKESFNNYDN